MLFWACNGEMKGKGKIVDYFAPRYDMIARFQGGPNAGHTLYVNDKKVVLHQIPSGIFHEQAINLIGNGVVLDPVTLKRECETVTSFGIDFRKNLIYRTTCSYYSANTPRAGQSFRNFKRK